MKTHPRAAAALLLALTGWLGGGCVTPPIVGSPVRHVTPLHADWRRPALEWEAFPRPADRERDPRLAGARNATYELKIWRVGTQYAMGSAPPFLHPDALVYSRAGLVEPRHTVEESLEVSAVYAISVRARFELDGQARVTRWATLPAAGNAADLRYLLQRPIVPQPLPGLLQYRVPVPPEPARRGQ